MRTLSRELAALWRGRSLAWLLARRDLATRHAAAAGGIAWAYVQPLLVVAAYYLLFDVVFSMRVGDAGGRGKPAGQFLIVGALAWMAFSDALSRGMNSLLEAGSLLQKNALPAVLFPARAVLSSGIVYLPLFVVVACIYAATHGLPLAVAAVVPLLLMQLVLSFILGYLLAILAAALRDTVQIVTFFLSVGIFLSPVLFPLSMFPEAWRWVLWLNPMTPLVVGYQAILLDAQWPPLLCWVVPLAWIAGAAALVDLVLARCSEQLVDWL
ncbi:ABC transporter permease [Ramlibacter sp.]|uniref:ABC transporter permease n=1 Tax=Ramlibacter sp. TaxID=1917967 RepID=UPI0035AE952D